MAIADGSQERSFAIAEPRLTVGTARMKSTAAGWCKRARHIAKQGQALAPCAGLETWNRAQ